MQKDLMLQKVQAMQKELAEIEQAILTCDEDWDWLSVKDASRLCGLSKDIIYRKIRKGEVKYKQFETKILVSKKSLNEVNDAHNAKYIR